MQLIKRSARGVGTALVWSITSSCRHEQCPVFSFCTFSGKEIEGTKCEPELNAVTSIQSAILSSVPDQHRTAEVMNDIGFKLIPLYQILVKLYMWHDYDCVVSSDERGKFWVNPVLKEIRNTIKDIDSVQKSMGLGGSYLKAAGLLAVPGFGEAGTNILNGDPNYYASICKKEET